jgi:hypothetical protein
VDLVIVPREGKVMLKVISAVAAAALIAGGIVAFLGTSATVNAGTPDAAVRGDVLATEAAPGCVNRGWPYFDHGCRSRDARTVRLVTTDRF